MASSSHQNPYPKKLPTRKHAGLDSGSVSDGLVGVDATRRLLAVEELLDELLDLGAKNTVTSVRATISETGPILLIHRN
jgi:hypothetical protein